MHKRKTIWRVALAGTLATFFAFKGEKITQIFAGWTFVIGSLSVSEIGVIGGLVLGVASFVLTWVYKHKNHHVLKTRVQQGQAVTGLLNEDDQ